MSASIDDFRDRCEFYRSKCRQKLYRTQLSHNLALDHLAEGIDSTGNAQIGALLKESLNDQGTGLPYQHEKLVRIVAESHFLTLKANFEYFLNRILFCLWSWRFESLARRSRKKVALQDAIAALADEGTRERIIDNLIPAHGLDEFKIAFKETIHKSLPEEFKIANAPGIWDQIQTAFAVRNLVEHCNGKVDQDFLRTVQWMQSSWRDFPMSDQAKIEVRRKDFNETCAAMLRAVEIITALTGNCSVE
jgi:hypothetical protein